MVKKKNASVAATASKRRSRDGGGRDRTEEEDDDEAKQMIRRDQQELHEDAGDNNSSSSSSSSSSSDDRSDDSAEDSSDNDDEGDALKKRKGTTTATAFSDENATWLKPKQQQEKKSKKKTRSEQLLSSSDEDDDDDEESIDGQEQDASEDDDGEDQLLDIEKQARIRDDALLEEERAASTEMQHMVDHHTEVYHLPTPAELEADYFGADRVVPPSEIRQHVDAILEVLAAFKTRREPGRARKEYLDVLSAFLAELYGYLPELVGYFLTMFSPVETVEFMTASEKPRPLVIRTNTLKARRKDLAAALMKRGVALDPLASWSKVGILIRESPVPIGATPEYLSGMYMLQSAASMCPVLALEPAPGDRVLDMSAAPGGKTSYLAQLMRNTGVIFANDLKQERQKATVANLHRLGVKNVVTCLHDGRKMGALFKNRFDRILLDAPCSGLGVISRDPSVKVQRTITDIKNTAHLQKELLISAIDALKCHKDNGGSGSGTMVYSTCSVSVAENEEVVHYALQKRDIRVVPTGSHVDFGRPGFTRYGHKRFHPSVENTRRFYPHVHNMDGFFVAKIEKLSDRRPEDTLPEQVDEGASGEEAEADKNDNATNEVEDEAAKGRLTKKKTKGGVGRKGGKRKASEETMIMEQQNKKQRQKTSIPPQNLAASATDKKSKKKQRLNAKVTKPRRMKKAAP